MDPQWQAKIEQDIKEAAETALPEDDEDLQMLNGVRCSPENPQNLEIFFVPRNPGILKFKKSQINVFKM